MNLTPSMIQQATLNNIPIRTLKSRLRAGWDVEKAVTHKQYVRQDKHPDEIITQEDYDKAAEKGITRENVWKRVNNGGWSVERAISEPVLKKGTFARNSKYGDHVKIAEANGISYQTFWERVNTMGWSLEKASNTLLRGQGCFR